RLRHVDMVVGMDRRVASKRSASELATPVGDHFVDVHVELGAAARHPDVQGKHVVMLACQDFITGLNDQLVVVIVQSLAVTVRDCGGLLQSGVGCDHFAGNQVFADAEMLKRALGLGAPKLVGGYVNDAETVGLFSGVGHVNSPG